MASNDDNKNLQTLLLALRCSKTKLDIDYAKFMELSEVPTIGAAKKRVSRAQKALGISFTGGGGDDDGDGKGGGMPAITKKRKAPKKEVELKPEPESEEAGSDLPKAQTKKAKNGKDGGAGGSD